MFPIFPQNKFGEAGAVKFWPLVAAAVAAAAATTNAAISAAEGRRETNKTRDYNAEQAQINRDWQERMSNTSYQRSMADMKEAGLNPMLAAWSGGASTPSGATASSTPSSASSQAFSNLGTTLANTANNITNAQLNSADAKLAKAQAETEAEKPDLIANEKANLIQQTRERKALAEVAENEAKQSAYNAQFVKYKTNFLENLKSDHPDAYDAIMFSNMIANNETVKALSNTAMGVIKNRMSLPSSVWKFISDSPSRLNKGVPINGR